MKNIIISAVLIVVITVFAFTSSALVSKYLNELGESVETYASAEKESAHKIYQALYEDYKKAEVLLCIVIDDESLIQIEEDFTDIIVHTAIRNSDEAQAAIKRLICHLEQIRRLSGFNIKSIL